MINNEKPTRAFCLLGKENNLMDDMSQIKDGNGVQFVGSKERAEYVRKYYEGLYKRKVDNLMRIEDFLSEDINNNELIEGNKLNEAEQATLEGEVTLEEMSEVLKSSNMHSSSGWDGISYWVIMKFFMGLGPLIVKLANEGFANGELTSTFRTRLIKLIPKKGNAVKVGDWRPITLLCCGYKLISGIVAKRMEKYMQKIIGRSQNGFQRVKNMSSCTLNIMDRISGAWESAEEMGVLCIDFVKAFDSIEHVFIERVMRFFNYGNEICENTYTTPWKNCKGDGGGGGGGLKQG